MGLKLTEVTAMKTMVTMSNAPPWPMMVTASAGATSPAPPPPALWLLSNTTKIPKVMMYGYVYLFYS